MLMPFLRAMLTCDLLAMANLVFFDDHVNPTIDHQKIMSIATVLKFDDQL